MERHGNDMTSLAWHVIILDYDAVRSIAEDIAAEPRIARPEGAAADTLNTQLPPVFFDVQDDLLVHARRLADAAGARDDAAMADALGDLSATCVRCHHAFLNPTSPVPTGPP